MKADARASELIEEIASLRKNNLNLQKEKKEVAELLAQSKMRGEESQKRCDQNEEKASESLQRLNKLHNEFSALERWERAKSLGTCNGYIYSSSSCLHRLIIKITPFSLEWPQCFRPCYAAQFLLSNVRRNTVALQVAKELRGVTGHPGNLQRISIFLFRATLPKSNPEANFKRMLVISRHTMRAEGTSTKLSPRCVCDRFCSRVVAGRRIWLKRNFSRRYVPLYPSTPMSDEFEIPPAASTDVLHHTHKELGFWWLTQTIGVE